MRGTRCQRLPLRRVSAVTAVTLLLAASPSSAQGDALPSSALAVREGGAWRTWWRSAHAPAAWPAPHPTVARAVRWRTARPGLEWGELRLAGRGEAWRVRVVLARVDPARFEFRLREETRAGGTLGDWSVERASAGTVLAFNAGHFSGGQPWGWLVSRGEELQPPGSGALAMALAVDERGIATLLPPDAIPSARGSGTASEAFQSYPMLLAGEGRVPTHLRGAGRGVDLAHRDARLAIGTLRDGRLLIAMTRFEVLNGALAELPFGLTTPEMAALMGALGAERAMLLDGGLSAQMLVRTADGRDLTWKGLRRVPLAMEVFERGPERRAASRR
jgi:hypothetical protein